MTKSKSQSINKRLIDEIAQSDLTGIGNLCDRVQYLIKQMLIGYNLRVAKQDELASREFYRLMDDPLIYLDPIEKMKAINEFRDFNLNRGFCRGNERKANGGVVNEWAIGRGLLEHVPGIIVSKPCSKIRDEADKTDLRIEQFVPGKFLNLAIKKKSRERWQEEHLTCTKYRAWFITTEDDLCDEAVDTMTNSWQTLVFVPDVIHNSYDVNRRLLPLSSLPDLVENHFRKMAA
jgi:hypothetical protein